METLIIVGELKYTTLKKIKKVSNRMWDWSSLVDYCSKNNLNYFTLDDYCDTINGVSDEDCSIDFSKSYLQYCNVTLNK